jgi:hypothetical protein
MASDWVAVPVNDKTPVPKRELWQQRIRDWKAETVHFKKSYHWTLISPRLL